VNSFYLFEKFVGVLGATDSEKRIERKIFQHLARAPDIGRLFMLNAIYDEIYKSDSLLTPAAFDNGKLIRHDDLRSIVRQLAADGSVTQRENVDWFAFSLTDAG